MSKDLQQKLQQWAPEPPASVWSGLQDKLPAADELLYARKLENFATQPPAQVWENIQTTLDSSAPVVRMKPKYGWKHAAAIVAATLLLFSGLRQYYFTPAGNATIQNSALLPAPKKNSFSALPQTQPVQRAAAATASVKSPGRKLSFTKIRFRSLQRTAIAAPPETRLQQVIALAIPKVDREKTERYIVVPMNEEAAIKLPKKVYTLFRCDTAPNPVDCEAQLASLRMQVANASPTATADFTGLLEIIRNVR